MSRDIKELVKGILTGEIKTDSLSKEEFNDVNAVMDLIKAKILTPEEQKKVGKVTSIMDEEIYEPQGKHNPVTESPKNLKKSWVEGAQWSLLEKSSSGISIKYHGVEHSDHPEENGAHHIYSVHKGGKTIAHASLSTGHHEFGISPHNYREDYEGYKAAIPHAEKLIREHAKTNKFKPSGADHLHVVKKDLEKAIKPSLALDYGKINPEQNPLSNPEAAKQAKAARYTDVEAKAPTIDYKNNPATKPQYYKGAADRAKAVRAKLDAESQETAVETIARRQKMKKEEGTNEEQEPSAAERSKMTAKSEKEPHKDDPAHEKKEQKKAKKIKEEAEDILDMHKAEECYKMSERGQWSIEKFDEKKPSKVGVQGLRYNEIEKPVHDVKDQKVHDYEEAERPVEITAQPTKASRNLYGGYEGGGSKSSGRINPKVRG